MSKTAGGEQRPGSGDRASWPAHLSQELWYPPDDHFEKHWGSSWCAFRRAGSLESDNSRLTGQEAGRRKSSSLPLDSTVHEGCSPGDILGGYRILGRLGAGGMGQVFRARDSDLERDVALKLLHPRLTSHPRAMSRFRREARLLAAVHHPNIATIFGTFEDGGVRVLVMELVDGETLAQRLGAGDTGRMAVPEALGIARQIATALEAAHRKGIVHRDLKPANVMVSPEGWVKVLDFGIAKVLSGDGEGSAAPSEKSRNPRRPRRRALGQRSGRRPT